MQKLINQVVAEVGKVLLGKEQQIRLALTCLFAKGHLLIEDLPGMGKTTLAHALANVLGLRYNRIQFTSDLLPADILGVSVFDKNDAAFHFHEGPVFTQVLLADEINRTTPKTQSALLEAMEEGQVTVDGETRRLPDPFFVIATQNPVTQSGTFPLPESQLDRFLMRISLGYPDPKAERALFLGGDSRDQLAFIKPCVTYEQLLEIRRQADAVQISDSILDYLQRLVHYTRTAPEFAYGLSPRGALSLLRCAKTWALMHGRKYLIPEDIQTVTPAVVGHRIRDAADYGDETGYALADRLLNHVDVIASVS